MQQSNLANKDAHKLQKHNQILQEDNNMLKIKSEILIDMIAEVYSEFKLETDKKKARKSPR
jgi:poly-beta-hydroxyalkanoate depolymerase